MSNCEKPLLWFLVIFYFPIHRWPLGHRLVPEALRCPRNLIVDPTLTISNFVRLDSPWHSDSRLLAITYSRSRVTDYNRYLGLSYFLRLAKIHIFASLCLGICSTSLAHNISQRIKFIIQINRYIYFNLVIFFHSY